MGWESTHVTGNWNRSGTGPVVRSHHRANRTRSGTVPLRSHREVVGSFRNDRTQWNRCEHGRPVAFRSQSCGVNTALDMIRDLRLILNYHGLGSCYVVYLYQCLIRCDWPTPAVTLANHNGTLLRFFGVRLTQDILLMGSVLPSHKLLQHHFQKLYISQ